MCGNWTSSDMINWVQQADFPAGPRWGHAGFIFQNVLYVGTGSNGSALFKDLYGSSDGISFTLANSNVGSFVRRSTYFAVFKNMVYMFGGAGPSTLSDLYRTSNPTSTWSLVGIQLKGNTGTWQSNIPASQNHLMMVVNFYGEESLMLVYGNLYGLGVPSTLTTNNGTTWITGASLQFKRTDAAFVQRDNAVLILGGAESNATTINAYATGLSWNGVYCSDVDFQCPAPKVRRDAALCFVDRTCTEDICCYIPPTCKGSNFDTSACVNTDATYIPKVNQSAVFCASANCSHLDCCGYSCVVLGCPVPLTLRANDQYETSPVSYSGCCQMSCNNDNCGQVYPIADKWNVRCPNAAATGACSNATACCPPVMCSTAPAFSRATCSASGLFLRNDLTVGCKGNVCSTDSCCETFWVRGPNPVNTLQRPRSFHTVTAIDGGYLVIVGGLNSAFLRLSDVYLTSDGVTWSVRANTSVYFGAISGHTAVSTLARLIVAGGEGNAGFYGTSWRATDFMAWTTAVNPAQFPPRRFHVSYVFNSTIFIAAGEDASSNLLSDVYGSPDGWKTMEPFGSAE